MKKTLIAVALAGLASVTSTAVIAADPKAPKPDFEISGNFGLFSDYRFRGISQTDKDPALQGGFDLSHKSGLYIGTWGSNVADWANTAGNGMEIDVYAGFSTELPLGLAADIGFIRYEYPGNTVDPKQNTNEWYLGLAYGPVSYKFSRSTGNWFGQVGSSGSTYHDLSLEVPLNDQVSLTAHYGKQKVKGASAATDGFNDYKVGISYALPNDFSIGLDYVGVSGLTASEKLNFATASSASRQTGVKLYESTAVISLSKTF